MSVQFNWCFQFKAADSWYFCRVFSIPIKKDYFYARKRLCPSSTVSLSGWRSFLNRMKQNQYLPCWSDLSAWSDSRLVAFEVKQQSPAVWTETNPCLQLTIWPLCWNVCISVCVCVTKERAKSSSHTLWVLWLELSSDALQEIKPKFPDEAWVCPRSMYFLSRAAFMSYGKE